MEKKTIEIELLSPSELGLSRPPYRGEPCSDEGKTTCGNFGYIMKCENGEWRRTYFHC